jgi:DNA-binding transcriptional LysR family regulator
MINLNQLRVFYEAARSGSFTAAARKLFITQPAVTAQVRVFEDQCNLKFFKKKGRKVYLTDEGKTLYDYARKIFQYEKEIEEVIEDMNELKRGILRLATTKSYARYIMPSLLTRFHDAFPHIKIHLDEGSSLDMIRSLLELKNEVAVIATGEGNPLVSFIPFSKEKLVLIMAPSHPLSREKTVSLADLANEPIIMKEVGSGTRKVVNRLFEKKGFTPNTLVETSNTEFIKQLVQRGEGISFVVHEAVASELKEQKLITRHLEGAQLFLEVSIAYLKDQPLSGPAKAFLDILLKMKPKATKAQGMRGIMARMLEAPGREKKKV